MAKPPFSFWISPSASIPGRMALLITAYLILTNMSTSAHEFDTSDFTAMDIWYIFCRCMVAVALIESVLVMRIGRRNQTVMNPRVESMETPRPAEERIGIYDYYSFIIANTIFVAFCAVYLAVCFSHP